MLRYLENFSSRYPIVLSTFLPKGIRFSLNLFCFIIYIDILLLLLLLFLCSNKFLSFYFYFILFLMLSTLTTRIWQISCASRSIDQFDRLIVFLCIEIYIIFQCSNLTISLNLLSFLFFFL